MTNMCPWVFNTDLRGIFQSFFEALKAFAPLLCRHISDSFRTFELLQSSALKQYPLWNQRRIEDFYSNFNQRRIEDFFLISTRVEWKTISLCLADLSYEWEILLISQITSSFDCIVAYFLTIDLPPFFNRFSCFLWTTMEDTWKAFFEGNWTIFLSIFSNEK